jgi:hypothetical protein
VITLLPPRGQTLTCALAPGHIGWVTEQPNAYRVKAEEAYLTLAAEVSCLLAPE